MHRNVVFCLDFQSLSGGSLTGVSLHETGTWFCALLFTFCVVGLYMSSQHTGIGFLLPFSCTETRFSPTHWNMVFYFYFHAQKPGFLQHTETWFSTFILMHRSLVFCLIFKCLGKESGGGVLMGESLSDNYRNIFFASIFGWFPVGLYWA